MKTWIVILVTAVVVGGIAFTVGGFTGFGMGGEVPALVRIEPAALGTLIERVTAPGKIEPKTKVAISARVSARIKALPCEEGAEVVAGENPTMLVKLDSKDLEASLESARANRNAHAATIDVEQANLVAMRAELKLKELELRRNRQLLESKDVSQQAVDELQSGYDALLARLDSNEKNLIVLQHRLESAEADIDRAEDNLGYTSIYSPINGVVTRLNSEAGELAIVGTTNTPGTTIMEVADLSKMLLKAQVDEADIGGIREGQRAQVRVPAYPDRVFTGTVTQIALSIAQQSSQGGMGGGSFFEVEVLLDTEGDRIYSGLTADADIEIDEHASVLRVPSQAVLGRVIDELPADIQKSELIDKTKTLTPVVYRLVNGKSVVTPVKIGASDGVYTIVESGLNDGDQVVAGPYKVLEGLKHDRALIDETKATPEQRAAWERASKLNQFTESTEENRNRD